MDKAEVPAPNSVDRLEDLMRPQDYHDRGPGKKIRLRISLVDDGVEVLGDSLYVAELEKLLCQSGHQDQERVLCG